MISAREYAAAQHQPVGGVAVLYDHDHTAMTYAVADALAANHDRVVLLTPRTDIARAVNYCSAIGIHRRLHTLRVEIVTAARPLAYEDGRVCYENVFSKITSDIDDVRTLVYATPRRADDALASVLADTKLYLIGDCMAPRNLMIAIHEGHAIGNAL